MGVFLCVGKEWEGLFVYECGECDSGGERRLIFDDGFVYSGWYLLFLMLGGFWLEIWESLWRILEV